VLVEAGLVAYTDIAEMAADDDLRQRLYACVASLNIPNGAMWVDRYAWRLVASDPTWADRWALAGQNVVARRGWDASVISDEMILGRVRSVQEDKGDI
jgi:hypothetical protein